MRMESKVWPLLLALSFLCADFRVSAGESKKNDKKSDAAAEAKQAAQEEEQDAEDRKKGIKHQKVFHGTFMLMGDSDKADQVSSEVIGSFVTDAADKTPGRAFFVKVEANKADVIETLKKNNGKKLLAEGKLRNADKYLIVTSVSEAAATAPPKERGGRGGL